jgi:hypothetical protein
MTGCAEAAVMSPAPLASITSSEAMRFISENLLSNHLLEYVFRT